MDLWIRTQDKQKLLKVNDIAIENYIIYGYFDKNTEYEELGLYKTKERALEVLDEIQKKIDSICLGHDFGSPMIDLKNPTYIYEMPLD